MNISHLCFQKFKLKVKNPENPVAPGLCVPAVVEYETPESTKSQDRLVITVDGDVVEVPVQAYVFSCSKCHYI